MLLPQHCPMKVSLRKSSTMPPHSGKIPPMKAYLDNMATTPLDPEVAEFVRQRMVGVTGNPHALLHSFGRDAAAVVAEARGMVAMSVGVRSDEIVFTPSATISNNLAVLGVPRSRLRRGNHIIISAFEHPAVLLPAMYLAENEGFELDVVPVGADGIVDPEEVRARLRPTTTLVSVMALNNELGTIQPIAEIAGVLKGSNAFFHTDAAQAPGRIAMDFVRHVDMMTLSSHKVYGPKGAAALFIRRRKDIKPKPLFFGGGQENGFCSGTVNTEAVIGFARAMQIAVASRQRDCEHLEVLMDMLLKGILAAVPGSSVVGDRSRSVPHCVSVTFNGIDGETFLSGLARSGVAVSLGSACHGDPAAPSHVLTAAGLSAAAARRTIRFGLGRFTTVDDIEFALEQIGETISRIS